MKSLLYKEFRLVAHPMLYITLAFGAMFLIPAYPFYVIFFYGCLGLFFCFINGRENKDTYVYRALLNSGNIPMAAAAGFYQSLIGFVVVLAANLFVRKISKEDALF